MLSCCSVSDMIQELITRIFLLFSLVNHSCDPVADTILVDHRTVVLRAKCSIQEGEEVTISYTGHYSREDRETRQTAVRKGWGFTCW